MNNLLNKNPKLTLLGKIAFASTLAISTASFASGFVGDDDLRSGAATSASSASSSPHAETTDDLIEKGKNSIMEGLAGSESEKDEKLEQELKKLLEVIASPYRLIQHFHVFKPGLLALIGRVVTERDKTYFDLRSSRTFDQLNLGNLLSHSLLTLVRDNDIIHRHWDAVRHLVTNDFIFQIDLLLYLIVMSKEEVSCRHGSMAFYLTVLTAQSLDTTLRVHLARTTGPTQ